MLFCRLALPLDYPKDVLGVHDPVLLSVELDLRPRILANDHHIPDAYLDVLVCSHRDDLSALGLLLGRVGEHYPGLRRLVALDGPDHHPRSQRLELHLLISSSTTLTSGANVLFRQRFINSLRFP